MISPPPACVSSWLPSYGSWEPACYSSTASLLCSQARCAGIQSVNANGKEDDIFPIKAPRKAFKHLQGIYGACGARDRCHLAVGAEGHRFYRFGA